MKFSIKDFFSKCETSFFVQCIAHFQYLICPAPQANLKTLQVEQNRDEWSNWNYIFFCKIICLQLIADEKIQKLWLSLGGVVSPNQGCKQTNNCLRGLNEDKDFFSKFILFKRQREGGGKKLCIVIQFYPQRHLITIYNFCHRVQDCTQPAFTCSKLTIETLEQGVKTGQS